MKAKMFRITYCPDPEDKDLKDVRRFSYVRSKHLSGAVKQFYQTHDNKVAVCKVTEC